MPASNYAGKALTANLTTEATTLYKSVKSESSYGKVAVQQDMLVEKTREQRAAEIAETIISLREQRMCIVTGDTDATFSGEALGAAVEELTRLEQEYLSLFTGYSEYDTQTFTFDLVPDKNRDSQPAASFPFFQDNPPYVAEHHIQRHQDAPCERGKRRSRLEEAAPGAEPEELRIPQQTGKGAEQQVVRPYTAVCIVGECPVPGILVKAVRGICQETSACHDECRRQCLEQRCHALHLEGPAYIQPEGEACAHHSGKQGHRKTFCKGEFLDGGLPLLFRKPL